MSSSQKRILKYVTNPDKYFLQWVNYGGQRFYSVIEVGKGAIDRIQERSIIKAVKSGIITTKQIEDTNKL